MSEPALIGLALAGAGVLPCAAVALTWAKRPRMDLRELSHPLHELRGALAVLELGLTLLDRPPRTDVQLARRIGALRAQVARAELALGDIDWRRAQRRQARPLELTLVDLPALVRRTVSAWSALAPAYGGRVRCDWRAGPALIEANAVLLQRAFDNLIENGLEHGGGRVLVRAERFGGAVLVQVFDGGPGLPRPMDRHEEANWRLPRGHGLAIVRDVLAAIGARFGTGDSPAGPAVTIEFDAPLPMGASWQKAPPRGEALAAARPARAAGQA